MSEKRMQEPTENDNTNCHLQKLGKGTLICQEARGPTNEVNRFICFNCDVGKNFREIGCCEVRPSSGTRLVEADGGNILVNGPLFCNHHKRETSLDVCRTCERATP